MSWRARDEGVQFVIDEETMARLQAAAARRRVEVELLMMELLAAASRRVDEILDRSNERA